MSPIYILYKYYNIERINEKIMLIYRRYDDKHFFHSLLYILDLMNKWGPKLGIE